MNIKELLRKAENLDESEFEEVKLLPAGSWPECHHAVNRQDILAMVAAMGSQRTLLLSGEPGTGKSHLARAVAALTQRYFVSTVIKPDTEVEELLWSIDHTRRLADAQLAGATKEPFDSSLSPYIVPGPVWHAFEAPPNDKVASYPAPPDQQFPRDHGVVLLIDEVDKANRSLLNSLLEVLGNMSFEVPVLEYTVCNRKVPPIIVLTSNGDQSLPDPLLRRCVTYEITLPVAEQPFIKYMEQIAKVQMGDDYSQPVAMECAKWIHSARQTAVAYKPGAGEFVDLIRTLHRLEPNDPKAQIDKHFDLVKDFFLK